MKFIQKTQFFKKIGYIYLLGKKTNYDLLYTLLLCINVPSEIVF